MPSKRLRRMQRLPKRQMKLERLKEEN